MNAVAAIFGAALLFVVALMFLGPIGATVAIIIGIVVLADSAWGSYKKDKRERR